MKEDRLKLWLERERAALATKRREALESYEKLRDRSTSYAEAILAYAVVLESARAVFSRALSARNAELNNMRRKRDRDGF